jgi:Icc-related predicted phosphoesterase
VRVFFATDIHGSETCWRKFLNSGTHYEADVMILGGDMTGKALVPVIHDGGERWHGTLQEQRRDLAGEDAVAAFELDVIRRGYYPFRTTPDELAELESDPDRLDDLFHKEMLGTVERWMAMAEEKLAGHPQRVFVCPGNDDQFEVDDILAAAKRVELAEGRVVEVGDYQMASTGWSNVTPWATYREEPEDVLLERIRGVTLHGHIHEARGHARIGNTLCINPGSAYEQGELLGALIELNGKKVKSFVLTSG